MTPSLYSSDCWYGRIAGPPWVSRMSWHELGRSKWFQSKTCHVSASAYTTHWITLLLWEACGKHYWLRSLRYREAQITRPRNWKLSFWRNKQTLLYRGQKCCRQKVTGISKKPALNYRGVSYAKWSRLNQIRNPCLWRGFLFGLASKNVNSRPKRTTLRFMLRPWQDLFISDP